MRASARGTFVAVASAGALLGACRASTVPNQVLTKPAPVSATPAAPRTNGPWAYRVPADRQGFVVEQRAVVTIRTDTVTRTDTVASRAEVSFTFAPAGNVLAGTVSAFLVEAGGRPAATPPGLTTPFPVRAEYSARGSQLDFTIPREAAPCGSLALASAQSLRDLWFRPPDTLRVGVLWQDSASYVACRDGVPLRAMTRRTFRITSATTSGGRMLLTLSRTSRTVLEGNGAQFGEAIAVTGTGSGQLDYTLDPVTGEVVGASGTSVLDLTLRSRLRSQAVRQSAEIRIGRN